MGELETLRKENAAQREENAALRKQIERLVTEMARLTERVSELLAVAQRKQRKPTPEKPPVPPPTLDADSRRAFDGRPTAPAKPVEEPAAKTPTKPTGRNPVPAHLPAEKHELRPDACADCPQPPGSTSSTSSSRRSSTLSKNISGVASSRASRVGAGDAARARRSVRCPRHTSARRSRASGPPGLCIKNSRCSLHSIASAATSPSAASRSRWAHSSCSSSAPADLLAGVDGLHWKQLLASRWMATDGTGLKVLIPKLPVAHNGYVELYRNREVALFQYEADKTGDAVANKLKPFRGTLTADAEHRFNSVYDSGRVIEAGCDAHGRRKFRDAEETQPVLALEGGAVIGTIWAALFRA